MKKIFYFFILFLIIFLFFGFEISGQKKDNTLYFMKLHEKLGRKNSLRRMGPGQMYRALLGGPEFGSAVITPNEDVTAGSIGTWKIVYTVGEAGLDINDALNIYIPYGFSPVIFNTPSFPKSDIFHNYEVAVKGYTPGYTTIITTNPDAKLLLFSDMKDRGRLSEGTKLYIGIKGTPLKEGDKIIVLYGDTIFGSLGACAPYFIQDFEFTIFVLKNVDWVKFEEMVNNRYEQRYAFDSAAEKAYCIEYPPALRVVGREADGLAFTLPSIASVNEPFDLHVLVKDKYYNPAEGYEGTLYFESNDVVNLPETHRVYKSDKGFIRIPGAGKISRPGVYRLIVKDKENSFTAESNPIKIVSEAAGKRLYWGDLHIHSAESDGLGTPDWCNKFARDITALDFCCICDHALGVHDKIRESAVKFTEAGKFVSFSGFESGTSGGGHVNFYFIDDSPQYEKVIDRRMSRKKLWEHLLSDYKEKTVIAVPHNHAGGGWKDMNSPVVRIDEVYSLWGNSEYYDNTTERPYLEERVNWRPKGRRRTFQQALAAGLKLGAIASGDEHSGRGGIGAWDRFYKLNHAGIVAAYSKTLTKKGIFNSLWDRCVYGTTGARIIVDFSINGYPMGSEFYVGNSNEKKNIKVKIEGTDNIKYAAVIKNNVELVNKKGYGKSMTIEISDDRPIGKTDYYYIRVVQEDTHIAWSSPIWVSLKSLK